MTETNPDTTDAPETTPTPEPGDVEPDNGGDEGDEGGDAGDGEGAGPAEDIQNDPAYNPDDPELKGIKGG
jgi:hypothetical protein